MNVLNCAHSVSKLAGHASLSHTYSNTCTLVSILAQLVHYVAHTHTVHIQYTEGVSRGVCHNVLVSRLHTEDAGALIIAQGVTDKLS